MKNWIAFLRLCGECFGAGSKKDPYVVTVNTNVTFQGESHNTSNKGASTYLDNKSVKEPEYIRDELHNLNPNLHPQDVDLS